MHWWHMGVTQFGKAGSGWMPSISHMLHQSPALLPLALEPPLLELVALLVLAALALRGDLPALAALPALAMLAVLAGQIAALRVLPEARRTTSSCARRGGVAAPAGGAFEDALFMVAVRPVDEANDVDALPLFQGVMPKTSVIASDARGGLAARAPSPGVELLTKDGVRLALFSRPPGALSAEALVDAFVRIRDAHRDEPRARANALRAWLKSMHDAKRVFSLALFDGSNRVFAAWTPRSAPMSFGCFAFAPL